VSTPFGTIVMRSVGTPDAAQARAIACETAK
jgi:hypothetical protein